MPDFSDLNAVDSDWSNSPYAGTCEDLPTNLPTSRGKPVKMYTMLTPTCIMTCSTEKLLPTFFISQQTVETATFGAESSATRTTIEQLRSNKMTLLYLGVPIQGQSIMLFGDNKTVVDSTTQPHSRLHKHHIMLSYQYVHEALASGAYIYIQLKFYS